MRKWIIIILLVLMTTNVQAGFFTSNAGQQNQNGGFWSSLNSFFTLPSSPPQNVSCSFILNYNSTSYCTGASNETYTAEVYDTNFENCCNLTGTGCYRNDTFNYTQVYTETVSCGSLRMYEVAIAILVIGTMFFLIYFASKLKIETNEGVTIPINSLIKSILYIFALFIGFISIQTAYGISQAAELSSQIDSNIRVLYQVMIWFYIVLGSLLLLGVLWNTIISVYDFITHTLKLRKVRR